MFKNYLIDFTALYKLGLPVPVAAQSKGSITLGELTSYSLANLLAATKFALCNNVVF